MTADHLRSLSRLTSNIRLAFDADKAGINATERAIPIAQSVGVDLKVITMPEGIKDPDELIQKDPNAWRDAAQNALDIVAWTLNKYSLQYDKKTAEGKRQLSTKALAVLIKPLTYPKSLIFSNAHTQNTVPFKRGSDDYVTWLTHTQIPKFPATFSVERSSVKNTRQTRARGAKPVKSPGIHSTRHPFNIGD